MYHLLQTDSNHLLALGIALYHVLWQGALIGIGCAIALRALKEHSPHVRYGVAYSALVLMGVLACTTVWWCFPDGPSDFAGSLVDEPSPAHTSAIGPANPVPLRTEPFFSEYRDDSLALSTTTPYYGRIGNALYQSAPWMALLWILGTLLMSLRLSLCLVYVRLLPRHGVRPVPEHIQLVLDDLLPRMQLHRPIRILQSIRVRTPCVVGCLRPVILIPASACCGLDPEQLGAVLAHELAHIRRHDFLMNLVQHILQILLFFHPVTWWLQQRICTERELCCDDLAVIAHGDTRSYAEALAALAGVICKGPPLAPAASGSPLMRRIHRLVGSAAQPPTPSERWLAGAATVLVLTVTAGAALVAGADTERKPLFDIRAIRDVNTLDVKVVQEWHVDTIDGTTRQKLIEISVVEWWPGGHFRVPVRLIVPRDRPATGLHITGEHAWNSLSTDAALNALDTQLIAEGVGIVHTVVQPQPELPGGEALDREMFVHLLRSHNPRYTPFWIWPMTLMRAVTAAHAETDHFLPGKVAASGRSKNGAAPATALIADDRFTALWAGGAPAYVSPARLYQPASMAEIRGADVTLGQDFADDALNSSGITFGFCKELAGFGEFLGLRQRTLAAGWTPAEFQQLMARLSQNVAVTRHWNKLMERGVDLFFQPGTHDWVAYDILWGAQHHPELPVYYKANDDGMSPTVHPAAETEEQNREALIIEHFTGQTEHLLAPPTIHQVRSGDFLDIEVRFNQGPPPESGRIWWIFDRDPGGSAGYLWKQIPDNQWLDMTPNLDRRRWTARIPLEEDASRVDFFSNHGRKVRGRQTYLSSPYTRFELERADVRLANRASIDNNG